MLAAAALAAAPLAALMAVLALLAALIAALGLRHRGAAARGQHQRQSRRCQISHRSAPFWAQIAPVFIVSGPKPAEFSMNRS